MRNKAIPQTVHVFLNSARSGLYIVGNNKKSYGECCVSLYHSPKTTDSKNKSDGHPYYFLKSRVMELMRECFGLKVWWEHSVV